MADEEKADLVAGAIWGADGAPWEYVKANFPKTADNTRAMARLLFTATWEVSGARRRLVTEWTQAPTDGPDSHA